MATLTELQTKLDAYRKAEDSILAGGQSCEFAGRKLTRANLAEIRAGIQSLEQRIAIASGGRHGQVVFGGRR